MADVKAPPAEGDRLPWAELPEELKVDIARICGGPVIRTRTQRAGFSPGLAARVWTARSEFFVKAVSAEVNPKSPMLHRREAHALRLLAGSTIRAPRLIASVEAPPWVALVLEALPGSNPTMPWCPADVVALVRTLDELSVVGNPCPVVGIRDLTEDWAETMIGWGAIATQDHPAPLDDWCAAHLATLVRLEASAAQAIRGDALLHFDVRGDNLLIHRGIGTLVDWAAAAVAHPLFEIACLAPSVTMQGGPTPEQLVAMTRVGRAAELDRLLPMVAAFAGLLTNAMSKPAPPGLPTVRAFQRAQAEVAVAWLQRLLA